MSQAEFAIVALASYALVMHLVDRWFGRVGVNRRHKRDM